MNYTGLYSHYYMQCDCIYLEELLPVARQSKQPCCTFAPQNPSSSPFFDTVKWRRATQWGDWGACYHLFKENTDRYWLYDTGWQRCVCADIKLYAWNSTVFNKRAYGRFGKYLELKAAAITYFFPLQLDSEHRHRTPWGGCRRFTISWAVRLSLWHRWNLPIKIAWPQVGYFFQLILDKHVKQ